MSAELEIRNLRRKVSELEQKNRLLESKLKKEEELNASQWKMLHEAEMYIGNTLSVNNPA